MTYTNRDSCCEIDPRSSGVALCALPRSAHAAKLVNGLRRHKFMPWPADAIHYEMKEFYGGGFPNGNGNVFQLVCRWCDSPIEGDSCCVVQSMARTLEDIVGDHCQSHSKADAEPGCSWCRWVEDREFTPSATRYELAERTGGAE